MKVYEVFDASTPSRDIPVIAKQLILHWRQLAAKHDLTIDGSSGRAAHDSLPMSRKSFMLFGGRLKIKGSEKQEAQRSTALQERVRAFLDELWPSLRRLQVKALKDLKAQYIVKVRVDDGYHDGYDGSSLRPITKTSVDEVFKALRFKDALGRPVSDPKSGPPHFAIFTWKLEISHEGQ